jgi:hypothetical protein
MSVALRNDIRRCLGKRKEEIVLAFLIFLLFLFIYRNLPIGEMLAYADLPPFPENPTLLWSRFVSIWQNEHLGFSLPERSFQVLVGVVISLFGNPILVQKALLLSTLPLAIISMYFYTAEFVETRTSRFVTSVLYGLNPISIGRFVNGGPLDYLLLYAVLPLLWLQLTEILRRKSILNVLAFAVLSALVGSFVYTIFWATVPFAAILIVEKVVQSRRKGRTFLRGVFLVSISFLLFSILVLPDILLTLQRSEILVIESDTLFESVEWSYSTPTPLNLLCLAGNGGDIMMRLLGYNELTPWTVLGLIIPIIAFSSYFLARKKKREHIFLFSAMAAIAMIFILLTRLRLTYQLFEAFPMLFSLKNPSRLMYPMGLALCSLFGIGLDEITRRMSTKTWKIPRRNVRAAILNVSILSLILLYMFPVLGGGTVGLHEVYGDSYFITSDYEAVLNWINEQRELSGFFRTLWLPYDYATQIKLNAADPHNVGVRSGAAWLAIPNADFVREIFETIREGKTNDFDEILNVLDVKYVIVDLGSDQIGKPVIIERQVAPWIVGEPGYFKAFLEEQDCLHEAARIGNLVVYENEKFAASYICMYDSLVFLTSPRLDESVANDYPLTPNLLLNPDFENDLTSWWANEKASIDDQVTINGESSARISNNDTEVWASIAQSVPIQRRGTYHFSVWVKAQDSNDPQIKLVWSGDNDTVVQTDYIVQKDEIEDTTNWLRVTRTVEAPENATKVSIRLVGGLSFNAGTVATTWFDNVEFYEVPTSPSDSFAQNFLTLTNVPEFISEEHLVIFEKGMSHDEILEALGVSNVIAFSHPTINQLIEYADVIQDQKLALIFEAETLNAPGRKLLLNNTMSNGQAIALGENALSLEFYAPISGYYEISFSGSGTASILADAIPLNLTTQHETEALQLEKGNHALQITGENTILDQIRILSAKNLEDLDNIFGVRDSTNDIISIESGIGHYSIEAELGEPSFLVFGESYDPDWIAHSETDNLRHFRAYSWSNAFYIHKTGKNTVEISFAQQPLRDMTINIWILCWIAVSAALIWSWIRKRRHGRTQSTALDQCMLLRLQNCHRRQSWRRIDRV